jgi:predicted phage terminase large subunit-like protein
MRPARFVAQVVREVLKDTQNDLRRLGVSFKVVIEQEPGSGGKESAEATIRNLAGFLCIADKPGAERSKEVRAEPLACQVQAGNVYLHAGLWVDGFIEEAGFFPQGHKDQVDAASQAFHHLTVPVGIDLETLRRMNR